MRADLEVRFGPGSPSTCLRAPGRVNLIGEHTDYNGGPALPAAISLGTVVAWRARAGRQVRLAARGQEGQAELDLDRPLPAALPAWARIPARMLRALDPAGADRDLELGPHAKPARGAPPAGLEALFGGDLPLEAGLSSSASLAMASAALACQHWGLAPDWHRLLRLAQRVEQAATGVACGLLDQSAIAFGRAGQAVRFTPDAVSASPGAPPMPTVPLTLGAYAFLIVTSGVRRQLAAAPYNTRRQECEQALTLLRRQLPALPSLAALAPEQLEACGQDLDERLFRRVRHVVSEVRRVRLVAEALAEGAVFECGGLLSDSHQSLRHDFEVSCPELDTLVESAWQVSGVLGARLTGAGFGGSILVLAHQEALEELCGQLRRAYLRAHERIATCLPVQLVDGLALTGGRVPG